MVHRFIYTDQLAERRRGLLRASQTTRHTLDSACERGLVVDRSQPTGRPPPTRQPPRRWSDLRRRQLDEYIGLVAVKVRPYPSDHRGDGQLDSGLGLDAVEVPA